MGWNNMIFVFLCLDPYTDYDFQISANNSKGYGDIFNQTFLTDESGTFRTVQNIHHNC